MRKAFVAMLAAAACAAAAVTAPAPAQARNEGAIAAGVVGGLAVGAMIGASAAHAYPAYRPGPGYVVYSGYYHPYPVSCPGGFWARKPVAFDRAGRPVAWSKPRFICP